MIGLEPESVFVRAIEYLYQNRYSLKADLRGGGRGRPSRQIGAVNAYQRALEDSYSDWADETADEIDAETDAENQKKVIDKRLVILLALLIVLGRKKIPAALELGLSGEPPTPDSLRLLASVLADNERFLADNFIPALRAKLERALTDPDIILAMEAGEGAEVLRAVVQTLQARLSMYAGHFWDVFNVGRGIAATLRGAKLRWSLDPTAQHCTDCLQYGDREYDSFDELTRESGGKYPSHGVQCLTRCRCELELVV